MKILNPHGTALTLPRWAIEAIRQLGLREWNSELRCWQISARYFSLLDIVKNSHHSFDRAARGHSSGPAPLLYQLLGPECDGPSHRRGSFAV